MALSDDQKAMLRLLAQREQGYDDLASLMGLSVDDVRTRVQVALEELDREEAAAPALPPPEPPKAEAAPVAEPEESAASPKAAAPRPKSAPTRKKPARRPLPKLALPSDGRMRVVAGAAGALAVVLIFILIAGVFGGGDGGDSSESSASGDTTGSTTTAAAASDQITQAMLSPVDGGDGSGQAVFGRIRDTAVLQVEAEGLEPSPPGQLYTVWLYRSPRIALRVGAVKVTDGRIGAQFPVPTDLLGYIAGGGFNQIDISLTPTAAYKAEVAQARQEQRLPAYTGTSVLRGEITGRLVEAGKAAGN